MGDIIKNIRIIEQTRHGRKKAYIGTCQICGDTDIYTEHALLNVAVPCHVCNGKKVKPGFNDLATTHPWMMDFFVNKEEAKEYQAGSNQRVMMKCPYCGTTKLTCISKLKDNGHITCKCKTKISQPENFFSNFLEQLNIEYVFQATSDNTLPWAKKYRYDFYFVYNNETYIVETHGMQHYRENTYWRESLESQQQIDHDKQSLAQKYVDHYIIIDCRYSRTSYMSKSIMDSELPCLLNFTKNTIDWDKCANRMSDKIKIKRPAEVPIDKIRESNKKRFEKRNEDLKIKLKSYLCDNDKPNYKDMRTIFHADYRKLKELIDELINEGQIRSDVIKTRKMKG